MLIGTAFGAIVDFLQHRESKADIEQELNAQFNGRRFSVSTYQNEEINLIVDAIHARPKFAPTEEAEGIARVEADHFFTQLETERTDPTLKERLRARILGQWITTVRLTIENGDVDSIRPPGLNLGYITVTTAMRYQGYDQSSRSVTPISPIRVADTHDLQSDKLEIKIRHDGPVGNYAERITDSIALLQEIQDNMEYYATIYRTPIW